MSFFELDGGKAKKATKPKAVKKAPAKKSKSKSKKGGNFLGTVSELFLLRSSNNSLLLPKHAKPAFLVLAPFGNKPLSRIKIFAFLFLFLYDIAELKPTIPAPITTKSNSVKYCFNSQ